MGLAGKMGKRGLGKRDRFFSLIPFLLNSGSILTTENGSLSKDH